jgi:hypothetical protein
MSPQRHRGRLAKPMDAGRTGAFAYSPRRLRCSGALSTELSAVHLRTYEPTAIVPRQGGDK